MSVTSSEMAPTSGSTSPRQPSGLFGVGRMFVNPLFDYLLIGGVLSLIAIPFLPQMDLKLDGARAVQFSALLLVANSCHFAASTVRLYTKEGTFKTSPFYTMGFPIVFLLVIGACLISDDFLGRHLFTLYLTWSPYHYAAQAFGLAMMYAYRSSADLRPEDVRLLWWVAMLPFMFAFLSSNSSGLAWFVPSEWFETYPMAARFRESARVAIGALTFATPVLFFVRSRSGGRPGIPLISFTILLSNGVWWVAFSYMNAFAWATVAHSVQYLAIMLIFHARENGAEGGSTREIVRVVLSFYAKCLALGYLLFQVLPYGYAALGFPLASSILVVAAAINIHHFMVDRVIWRQRKDPNMKVVVR